MAVRIHALLAVAVVVLSTPLPILTDPVAAPPDAAAPGPRAQLPHRTSGAATSAWGVSAPSVVDTVLVVQRGESLSTIASRLLARTNLYTTGQLMGRIRGANDLSGDRLLAGQTLRVPLAATMAAAHRRGGSTAGFAAHGLYATAELAGSASVLALADSLVAAGGNTIVFDIKDRHGELSYLSKTAMAVSTQIDSLATIARPARLVNLLHQRGLHVVARLTCFCDWRLARVRPDLVPLSRRGDGLWQEKGIRAWVDPSLPEVQDYLLDLVAEVADLGVDEIQLDYVRFPTEGNAADAVFAFDPEVVPKHEIITGFVRRAREVLSGTDVLLSADVFGVMAWGREADVAATGQNLAGLLPLLDVVSPMVYPSHFYGDFQSMGNPPDHPYLMVNEACRRLRTQAEAHGVAVRPWVQAFPYRVKDFDAEYIIRQVQGAEDAGTAGWLLWNPKSRYEVGLEAMRDVLRGSSGQ